MVQQRRSGADLTILERITVENTARYGPHTVFGMFRLL